MSAAGQTINPIVLYTNARDDLTTQFEDKYNEKPIIYVSRLSLHQSKEPFQYTYNRHTDINFVIF